MMATQIARELNLDRIVIPPHPGNFSAWGLLGADLLRSRARTHVAVVTPDSLAAMDKVIDDLIDLLHEDVLGQGNLHDSVAGGLEVSFDMRFRGQEHTLAIKPGHDGEGLTMSADQLEQTFRDEYQRTYGGTLEAPVEVVNIRASRRRVLPRRNENYEYETSGQTEWADCYSFAKDQHVPFQHVHRGDLEEGERYQGPAIVAELTSTTYVDDDFEYGVDANACMWLERIRRQT